MRDNLQRQIDIKNGYLKRIIDFSVDYDGYRDANNLMLLIDELSSLAKKALDNDDVFPAYKSGDEDYNILMEEIR